MQHVLELKSISYHYPQNKRPILNQCSLTINQGDLVSILGPNGAGKSTMLNCACGLLKPQAGEVLVNGTNINRLQQREIAKTIGYVQQNQKSTFPHTIFDYVLMGRASNVGLFHSPNEEDRAIAEEAIAQMELQHLHDAAITEISGGERQQAAIARVIAQKPQVILFDEPTAHLDYGNQIHTLRMIGMLRDRGFAVVMTTHNPDHCMMLGGRVAILDKQGSLEEGLVETLLTEEKLSILYHTNIRLLDAELIGRVACFPEGVKEEC